MLARTAIPQVRTIRRDALLPGHSPVFGRKRSQTKKKVPYLPTVYGIRSPSFPFSTVLVTSAATHVIVAVVAVIVGDSLMTAHKETDQTMQKGQLPLVRPRECGGRPTLTTCDGAPPNVRSCSMTSAVTRPPASNGSQGLNPRTRSGSISSRSPNASELGRCHYAESVGRPFFLCRSRNEVCSRCPVGALLRHESWCWRLLF